MSNNKQNNSAFTLIELSIVLIIIGLIVGGVLAGQELIKAAESRGVISQADRYNTAINTFRLKYSALPGDFLNASTMLPGGSGTVNGNGDGMITSSSGTPATTVLAGTWAAEHLNFWQHLSLVGIIEGSYPGTGGTATVPGTIIVGTHIPFLKNNRGGIVSYASTDSSNYYHLGIALSSGSTMTTANVLTPDSAYGIDSKVDDGNPSTGKVLAVNGIDTLSSGTTASATTCHSGSAAPFTYNLTNTPGYVCQLKYKMQ